jgi:hypothetical protein
MALPRLVFGKFRIHRYSKENRQAVYGIKGQDGMATARFCEPMAEQQGPAIPSACADFPEHRSVYRLVRLLLPMT